MRFSAYFFYPFLYFFLFIFPTNPSQASEVRVAVSANFAAPMKQISAAFQQATGHTAVLSVGATSKFYAQIKNGAPFDILLAADQITPEQLARENLAIARSQFTYATGKLVLWSAAANRVDSQGAVLRKKNFEHIAVASSQAPYGVAARQTLKKLNLWHALSPKIVQGESIGQTYSFVASSNAELGFVALSQVWEENKIRSGSAWIVPENLYAPLRQDAILLRAGAENPAARALLAYLKSDTAKKIIRSYGYTPVAFQNTVFTPGVSNPVWPTASSPRFLAGTQRLSLNRLNVLLPELVNRCINERHWVPAKSCGNDAVGQKVNKKPKPWLSRGIP